MEIIACRSESGGAGASRETRVGAFRRKAHPMRSPGLVLLFKNKRNKPLISLRMND